MIVIVRVKSHILEKVIGVLMALFGLAALYIFASAKFGAEKTSEVAIIEILLIVVLAILAQTLVLIRIYEQHQ